MSRVTLHRREPAAAHDGARTWTGATVPYDLVKEFCIALGVVALLAIVLTILFSSPDVKPSTIGQWARSDPGDFLTTATSELNGTSGTATYGPPYNSASDGQQIGPIKLAKLAGVRHPVDTARDLVLGPLTTVPGAPVLRLALARYQAAPPALRARWADAYSKALAKARFVNGVPVLAPGNYGPVAPMMRALLAMGRTGALDGVLLTSSQFFQTDYTKPLLFLNDGGLLESRATGEHLLGEQWGMMNETGSYPGQVWLWLYTFWYQIKPFSTSDNADALVWGVMFVLTLAFICIPFIPGVRSIPRWIPLYKLIWRDHYRRGGAAGPVPGAAGSGPP
ncbi:MAG: hypothetical protein ACXVFN_00385 [Solirubrobacteraceae bacterium]